MDYYNLQLLSIQTSYFLKISTTNKTIQTIQKMNPKSSYIFFIDSKCKKKKINYNTLIIYGYAFILEENDKIICTYYNVKIPILISAYF